MKLCFIDTLGLTYDGSTLQKRGLGGSESAVILMAKELAKIGFDVTVFNDCVSDDTSPGIYDNVRYIPIWEIENHNEHYDISIASRSVAAYAPDSMKDQFKSFTRTPKFEKFIANCKHRVLWMHDTFCDGDQLIEPFLLDGRFHEVFALSDFHVNYVSSCDHGARRMPEVMKRFVFQTRNGIVKYHDWVDISQKDPNLFVYNASVTKGMVPLVQHIWPILRKELPDAKLTIIGGYYRFRQEHGPDEQELSWRRLVEANPDINFTGVIKQSEIADILTKASFMIYPTAFPETFGISSLESLAYNTPLITTNFGALEETAIDSACYKIPYSIEPNSLFPNIPTDLQVQRFVNMTINAYHNRYLHQQKMYACNQVKDICTWDTVALQWKQHLFKKLGEYLPVDEYRKVTTINHRVREVFGRRFLNLEELVEPRSWPERLITVVTPVYNAEKYIERCILSVAQQDYHNYQMIIVDDCSTDNTYQKALDTINSLHEDIRDKFEVIRNDVNLGAVWNQVNTIENWCGSNEIVMLLDGDDWLVNNPNIFHKYSNLYNNGAEFTYGSCWSVVDNIPLIAQEYPPEVKANKAYRDYKFNWNMPYTHLRTFESNLMHEHLRDHGNYAFRDPVTLDWLKAGGDTAIFYTMIERANPDKVVCVSDVVYNYNDANPLNDYKVNGEEQNRTAKQVLERPENSVKKKILIAIPCKNDIEAETFKSIYDLIVPEGYETTFQYFYGYAVDQVRNLIADWTIKGGYDYLFAVDHDITFPPDALAKLLSHNKDMVTGVYRQRLETPVVEIYDHYYRNIPYESITHESTPPLVDIGGCGFGCVLVRREVFEAVGYPQFVYHQAISHAETFSEDLDFCKKVNEKGFIIWCDTTLLCGHIGQRVFEVTRVPFNKASYEPTEDNVKKKLIALYHQRHLPEDHKKYLAELSKEIQPKVIYDIGSNLCHWIHEAEEVWPDSKYVMFEAMDEMEFLYKEKGTDYNIGLLSSQDGVEVDFHQNPLFSTGSSMYHENPELSSFASVYTTVKKTTKTLDTVVKEKGYPLPDLIKIDVQGAELDILAGAQNTLQSVRDIIIEMQHDEYNVGAPGRKQVVEFLEGLGFKLVKNISKEKHDGDYHFRREGAAPTKAYIIWCDHPKSIEYREQAAKSCEAIGLPYEYFQGPYHKTADELWSNDEYVKHYFREMIPPAASAAAAQMNLWKLIAERKECAVILEHDALMLHPVQDMFIPDDMIVNLGYKLKDPTRYDHEAAGPPEEIIPVTEQHGCHSYIITHVTAQHLLDEIKEIGVYVNTDNSHFMRDDPKYCSKMPMGMMSPTPAIAWPRDSTIWSDGSLEVNAPFIESFKTHLRS